MFLHDNFQFTIVQICFMLLWEHSFLLIQKVPLHCFIITCHFRSTSISYGTCHYFTMLTRGASFWCEHCRWFPAASSPVFPRSTSPTSSCLVSHTIHPTVLRITPDPATLQPFSCHRNFIFRLYFWVAYKKEEKNWNFDFSHPIVYMTYLNC